MEGLSSGLSSRPFGILPGGDQVTCWTLSRGEVSVDVLDYGARLHALHAPDRNGAIENIVLGPDDLADHLTGRLPYAGGIVGRWANRLAEGRVRVDGTVHELATNESTTTLHGGPDSFDKRRWSAEPAGADDPGVTMRLSSPDGDNGFPGNLEVATTYVLTDDRTLSISIEATTDAPTVVNLTTHAYWDLGGRRRVAAHRLQVPAARMLAVDDDLLPTSVVEVDGTPFDLRGSPLLADVLDQVDVDHCFLLDDGGGTAAVLSDHRSGRRLRMSTNQPCVQVYLGGQLHHPHAGLAIEPQMAPDAPNRPDLDVGPRGTLHPGEVYRHRLTLRVDTIPA